MKSRAEAIRHSATFLEIRNFVSALAFVTAFLIAFSFAVSSRAVIVGKYSDDGQATEVNLSNGRKVFLTKEVGRGDTEVWFVMNEREAAPIERGPDVRLIIPDESYFQKTTAREVPKLQSTNDVLIEANGTTGILHEDGDFLPLKQFGSGGVKAYSSAWFTFNKETFVFISVETTRAELPSATLVIRASDGDMIMYDNQFHAMKSVDRPVLSPEGTVSFRGKPSKVTLSMFEKNPSYAELNGKSLAIVPYKGQQNQTSSAEDASAKFERDSNGFVIPPVLSRAYQARGITPDTASLAKLKAINTAGDEVHDKLSKKVFGQDPLLNNFTRHFKNSLTLDPTKPTVIVLTGPSGVGKTYLGENFAKAVFESPDHFLEIDGAAYQSDQFLAMIPLFGSAQSEGALTSWMKETGGNGVLVINEGDKMATGYWTRLMELFDKGVLTGGDGQPYKSGRLYVIITSNRGNKVLFPEAIKDWSEEEIAKRLDKLTSKDLKQMYMESQSAKDDKTLPREVLNRVDEFMAAGPLTRAAATKIAAAQVAATVAEAKTKYQVDLDVKDDAIAHLALAGFKSTDDGRQINGQTKSYLSQILLDMAQAWDLPPNTKVTISLVHDADHVAKFKVDADNDEKNSIILPAPRDFFDNPLQDPVLIAKLKNLPTVLNTRVIGQEAAMKSVAEAVTAKFGNAFRTRPLNLFLIGPTGTGKTETGKAVAEAMYGSPNRAAVVFLGGINNEADYNNIFGSQAGYVGSDIVRDFEKALMANPDGGVLILDEASNMGGLDKSMKEALSAKLFNMLEEGRWTSPVNGKVYDLSKYIFLFTGNDGEALFQGLSADDTRMAVYEQENDREKNRKLLRDAGMKEALIGRMDDVILMKPLLTNEIDQVVQKLFDEQKRNFEKQNRGAKLVAEDGLMKQMAQTFFTQDKGGRSVRDVLETREGANVILALVENDLTLGSMDGIVVKVGMTDNLAKKPYIWPFSPKRKVILKVTVSRPGQPDIVRELDATEFASKRGRMSVEQAVATAYHEAGHAVLNDPLFTGEKLSYITLYGGTMKDLEYLGYARYEDVDELKHNPGYEEIVATMAQFYAGQASQMMAGSRKDVGWENDLAKMRTLATRYFIDWGMDDEFRGLKIGADGKPELSGAKLDKFEKKVDAMMNEAKRVANTYLAQRWTLVRALASELLMKGFINEERFLQIQAAVTKSPKADWDYKKYMKQKAAREKAADDKRASGLLPPKVKICSPLLDIITNSKPSGMARLRALLRWGG